MYPIPNNYDCNIKFRSKIIHFVCTGKVEKDGKKIKAGGKK